MSKRQFAIDFAGLSDLSTGHSRFEVKYLSRASNLEAIELELKGLCKTITYFGLGIQRYENDYFDTNEFSSYYDHHQGTFPRTKTRIRTYNNSDSGFLEEKTKLSSGWSEKSRALVSDINLSEKLQGLMPVLKVTYNRIQFWHEESDSRVTIDTEIKFESLTGDKNSTSLDELSIIEVKKMKRGITPVESTLKQFGIRPSSFSKYCIGIAMLVPRVKTNNFQHIIKQIKKWNS